MLLAGTTLWVECYSYISKSTPADFIQDCPKAPCPVHGKSSDCREPEFNHKCKPTATDRANWRVEIPQRF
eukprot:2770435-Amphidinium_carterae.1